MHDSYHPKVVSINGALFFVITKRTFAGVETEYETVFKMPLDKFLKGVETDAATAKSQRNYWPIFGALR